MVKSFPVDPMHTIFINVVKKLCFVWRKGKNRYVQKEILRQGKVVTVFRKKSRRSGKMTAASIQAVDCKINLFNKFMPSDFSRTLSAFSESDSWKANQCRQFLLYVAPVALRKILDHERYEHMILLHQACRIMSCEVLCQSKLDEAERLLREFVRKCKHLLGIDFITPAVHALIHLPADCAEHGTLDKFDAFPFENFQGEIRSVLRGYAKPLQQLWKRFSERENMEKPIYLPMNNSVSGEKRARHDYGPTSGQSGDHHCKFNFNGMTLSLKKSENTLLLHDNSIIRASNFLKDCDEWYVIGQIFRNYKNSSQVFVWKVNGLSEHHFSWPLKTVVGKAVLLPWQNCFVCLKMLHFVSVDFCL
jgi:hypothetical protein